MKAVSRREVLLAGSALALAPRLTGAGSPRHGRFKFAYFSDTHVALSRNVKECEAMLKEIAAESPVFAINGGDVTDYGWRGEYENYRALTKGLDFDVHHIPGNHDVRWSPLGGQIFEEYVGKPYREFEFDGVHFLLLDSTVPLSHWGHYEKPMLDWLKGRLEEIGREAPVILGTHHWTGRDRIMIDNESIFHEIIRPYNVKLILTGHGHSDLLWNYDQQLLTMNKGLYQGSWQLVEVDLEEGFLRLSRRSEESKKLEELAKVSLEPKKAGDLRVNLPPSVSAGASQVYSLPGVTHHRWNGGEWQATVQEKVELPTSLLPGQQRLDVQSGDAGPVRSLQFLVRSQAWHEDWKLDLPGGVMSHVRLEGDSLFVSCMDGSLLRVDAITGKVKWRAKTGGYCHSSPLVTTESVLVGSADAHLHAVSKSTGKPLWSVKTPGPVYASPAETHGIVFQPIAGGFLGIDLASGEVRWKTDMPSSNTAFAQSVATTGGSRFFTGAWDSHVYALDLAGELLWRQPCQERTFAFSPAISSVLAHQGSVYVAANGNGLFRFDAETGQRHWEIASPGDKYGHSSPKALGRRLVVGCLGDKGQVRCVDSRMGVELWCCDTGEVIYDGSPAIDRDRVYIGSVPGVLNAIDLATGKLLGQYRLNQGHLLSTPVAGAGSVFVASYGNQLARLTFTPGPSPSHNIDQRELASVGSPTPPARYRGEL